NSLTALAALLLMTVPLPAAAQVDLAEGPSDEPSDELALGEGSAEGDVEFSEDEEEAFDDDGEEGASDEGGAEGEEEGPAKLLLGARYRLMVVPEFVFDMVGVDGGRSMWIQGGGPEIGFA